MAPAGEVGGRPKAVVEFPSGEKSISPELEEFAKVPFNPFLSDILSLQDLADAEEAGSIKEATAAPTTAAPQNLEIAF